MVAELCKPSCKLPFVTTGIMLGTNMYRPDINAYHKKTTVEYILVGYCLQCGNPFWRQASKSDKENHKRGKFCSRACKAKYYWGKIKEENLRVAYKNVDKKEFTEFFKKYQNFVYSEIYKYESEYHEDLIDRWQEQAIRWFYCIKKWEITNHKKCNNFAFLRKAIYYSFLYVQKKKLNSGEVFYSECGIAAQQKILGNYEEV